MSQIVLGAAVMGNASILYTLMEDLYDIQPNKAACFNLLAIPSFVIGGKICVTLYHRRKLGRRALISIGSIICGFFMLFATGDINIIFDEP